MNGKVTSCGSFAGAGGKRRLQPSGRGTNELHLGSYGVRIDVLRIPQEQAEKYVSRFQSMSLVCRIQTGIVLERE